MGHKVVCLDCKNSFSQGTDFNDRKEANCQNCSISYKENIYMDMITFNKVIIEADFMKAENSLLDKSNISIIKYLDFDHTTFDTNNKDFLIGISGQPIVYCIWIGTAPSTLSPKYIGHAGRKISRQRIRAHLTKKNKATGAQLERIKEELRLKKCIGISAVRIEPAYMRKALEEWLIDKYSGILEWNAIGVHRSKESQASIY